MISMLLPTKLLLNIYIIKPNYNSLFKCGLSKILDKAVKVFLHIKTLIHDFVSFIKKYHSSCGTNVNVSSCFLFWRFDRNWLSSRFRLGRRCGSPVQFKDETFQISVVQQFNNLRPRYIYLLVRRLTLFHLFCFLLILPKVLHNFEKLGSHCV